MSSGGSKLHIGGGSYSGSKLHASSGSRVKGASKLAAASSIDAGGSKGSALRGGRSKFESTTSKSSAGHHHEYRRIILPDGTDATPRPLLRQQQVGMGGEPGMSSLAYSIGEGRLGGGTSSSASATRINRSRTRAHKQHQQQQQQASAAQQSGASASAASTVNMSQMGRGGAGGDMDVHTTGAAVTSLRTQPPTLHTEGADEQQATDAANRASLSKGGLLSPGARGMDSSSKKGWKHQSTLRHDGSKSVRSPLSPQAADDDTTMEVVLLRETPTTFMLNMPGAVVATDAREKPRVEAQNSHYAALLQNKESATDRYVRNHAQTLNAVVKSKEAQAVAPATREVACTATSFELHDTVRGGLESTDEETDMSRAFGGGPRASLLASQSAEASARIDEMVKLSLVSKGCLLPVQEGTPMAEIRAAAAGHPLRARLWPPAAEAEEDAKVVIAKQKADKILGSGHLSRSLSLVELALMQNQYSKQHACYRAVPTVAEVDSRLAPNTPSSSDLSGSMRGPKRFSFATSPPADINTGATQHVASPHGGKGGHDDLAVTAAGVEESANLPHTADERRPSVHSSLRGLPPAITTGSVHGPTGGAAAEQHKRKLTKLWEYHCPMTDGRSVTALAWATVRAPLRSSVTQVSEDLLAVGYSSSTDSDGAGAPRPSTAASLAAGPNNPTTTATTGPSATGASSPPTATTTFTAPTSGGLICFWSLRNPEHPERAIHTQHGVTALDFSNAHVNLLAVGFAHGGVAIYDVFREEDYSTPVLESTSYAGTTSDPVWQIRWVETSVDRIERLVSISNDGKVTEWVMKKGLSRSVLMVLKRSSSSTTAPPTDAAPQPSGPGASASSSAGMGLLSSYSFGLCFDFLPTDSSLYLCGTEDGTILKCSVSYNETSLETYSGHLGPVYRLRFSPFWQNAFLSCSADWTVKLWNERDLSPVLTIQPTGSSEIVYDVDWSPQYPTVLASVTGDGKVVIWDLARSSLDPILLASSGQCIEYVGQHVTDGVTPTNGGGMTGTHMNMSASTRRVSQFSSAGNPQGQAAAGNTQHSFDESRRLSRVSSKSFIRGDSSERGGSGGGSGGGGLSGSNGVVQAGGNSTNAAGAGGNVKGGVIGGNGVPVEITANGKAARMTTLAFAKGEPILAAGNSRGAVEVYRLQGFEDDAKGSISEKAERLKAVMYPKGVPHGKD